MTIDSTNPASQSTSAAPRERTGCPAAQLALGVLLLVVLVAERRFQAR
jgi:hypothetical protein